MIDHRLIVQDHKVPDQRSRRIQDGNSQVTLGAEGDEILVVREESLHVLAVVSDLALENSQARRPGNVVLEILSEAVALPECARADAITSPLQTLGHERVPHMQRRGEMLNQ